MRGVGESLFRILCCIQFVLFCRKLHIARFAAHLFRTTDVAPRRIRGIVRATNANFFAAVKLIAMRIWCISLWVYDVDMWACANKVTLAFSRTGKPTDNGFVDAFNSKLYVECLNAHWFLTLEDARKKLENWLRHYNEDRPHSAIGYNVPIDLHNPGSVISQPLGWEPENSNSRRSDIGT